MGDKEGEDSNLGQRYSARTTESRVPLKLESGFVLLLVLGLKIL